MNNKKIRKTLYGYDGEDIKICHCFLLKMIIIYVYELKLVRLAGITLIKFLFSYLFQNIQEHLFPVQDQRCLVGVYCP